MNKNALIVGAGSEISAAVARALHRDGYKLALAARDTQKLSALAKEVDATVAALDAVEPAAVAELIASPSGHSQPSTSCSTTLAPRRASRAMPSRPPSPWASLPCEASPNRWPASCSRVPCPQRRTRAPRRRSRRSARPRGDR